MEENHGKLPAKILAKIPRVCTSSVMSVNAPIHALSILSIHPSDEEHQEILDAFTGTNYGEK